MTAQPDQPAEAKPPDTTPPQRRYRPDISGLRFTPDGTTILEITWQDARQPQPRAHTAVLSGPDHSIWRFILVPHDDPRKGQ